MKIWILSASLLFVLITGIIGLLQTAEIQYRIGKYYYEDAELEKAEDLLVEAAEKGHIKAKGLLIEDGAYMEGIGRLYGVAWFNEKQGAYDDLNHLEPNTLARDSDHVFLLGLSHFFGIKSEQDKARGCAFFRVFVPDFYYIDDFLIERHGVISLLESKMTPDEIKKSRALAKEMIKQMKAQ